MAKKRNIDSTKEVFVEHTPLKQFGIDEVLLVTGDGDINAFFPTHQIARTLMMCSTDAVYRGIEQPILCEEDRIFTFSKILFQNGSTLTLSRAWKPSIVMVPWGYHGVSAHPLMVLVDATIDGCEDIIFPSLPQGMTLSYVKGGMKFVLHEWQETLFKEAIYDR